MTNVIVPGIHATLNNLLLRKSTFVSISECQSVASTDRRGEGKSGRQPDIMFVEKHIGKYYKLMYIECSCLFCTTKKENDDSVKLWQETNDGMY
nr:4172_t:CDS:2 [Entrophospora candida]